jgi:hypothetical protein
MEQEKGLAPVNTIRFDMAISVLWKKYWGWISGLGAFGCVTAGFTMIQVDEYAAAIVCWFFACVCIVGASLQADAKTRKVVGRVVAVLLSMTSFHIAKLSRPLPCYFETQPNRTPNGTHRSPVSWGN